MSSPKNINSLTRSAKIDDVHLMLSTFAVCTLLQNKVGFYNINQHAEDLFCNVLNLWKGWKLENANATSLNTAGIDLIDKENKILVQVTSERSVGKVQHSLSKISSRYSSYSFFFLCFNIVPPPNWDEKQFKVPHHIRFDPKTNVLSIPHIANACTHLDDDQLERIWCTISSYVRGEHTQSALDEQYVIKWMKQSAGAYRRFSSFSNVHFVKDLDCMIQPEHSVNWTIIDLTPDLFDLKGENLRDVQLVKHIDALNKVCGEFAMIDRIWSEKDVFFLHDISKQGMKEILAILAHLAKKAAIDQKIALEHFEEYINI